MLDNICPAVVQRLSTFILVGLHTGKAILLQIVLTLSCNLPCLLEKCCINYHYYDCKSNPILIRSKI